MARIVSIGPAIQNIYVRSNFSTAMIGESAIFDQLLVVSKNSVDKISYSAGGSGVNAAVEFARHGHESIYIGSVARDSAGLGILNLFNHEGIDSSYTNIATKNSTGTSVVLLSNKSKKPTTLTAMGVAEEPVLDPSDLDLIQPDWLYASTGDLRALLKIFEKAKSIGTKVMFNPGKKELLETKKLLGLLEDVDILYVNKTEAASLVPGAVLSELLSHLCNYVETVIITDGAMGGIASNHAETYRFGIYEDIAVKDTSGAGDAFGAGFLAHLSSGKSFRTSLIYASANATSVVSKVGTTNGLLTGGEPLHPMLIQKI